METVDILRSALQNRDPRNEQAAYFEQMRSGPEPPWHKPYPEDAVLFDLTAPEDLVLGAAPLVDVIRRRRSRRHFTDEPLSVDELSFLLWATQGVKTGRSQGQDAAYGPVGVLL